MAEALYAEHPAVYDALYGGKDYDGEVEFVVERFAARGNGGDRVLIVGCGTGEHAKRLTERGFDVTGVDKYGAMVERARTKSEATFAVGALPDLPVDGPFDLVLLPFTVVNHLSPDEIVPSLKAASDALAEDGVLVFDHHAFGESAGEPPALRTQEREEGAYARLTQVNALGGIRYRWNSLVFAPDGRFLVDTHDLADYDPAYLVGMLEATGFDVEMYADYGGDPLADGEESFLLTFVAA